MIMIKRMIKNCFPNIIDIIALEKQKKKDLKAVSYARSLSETDYPCFLSELYKQKTGRVLDLEDPHRFTEKIQWRKLYDRDPIYTKLSDKFTVREWVSSKIGEEHLVPLLGVWDHFSDIDFETLPNQFVLKTNNASHTNIIVDNKKMFLKTKESAKRRMEYWLKTPFAFLIGLELQYQAIKPRILAEQYLVPELGKKDLTDYKFFCFSGVPYLCQVIGNRSVGETIDFYDEKWEHVSISRPPYPNASDLQPKPSKYEEMLSIASELSKGFAFVRVDLYEYKDKVFFGEMTFTPANGMMIFKPDEWDYKLGSLWNIHTEQVNKSLVY